MVNKYNEFSTTQYVGACKDTYSKGSTFLSTNIIVMENTKIAYKRMPQFDVLKLFAIYLVIWGHCIQYLISRYPPEEPMWYFIYSFHMPLFMIVSGFFLFHLIN